ncbi:hypothetical protein WA158_004249 [Blastocystis sp. Blastoise]
MAEYNFFAALLDRAIDGPSKVPVDSLRQILTESSNENHADVSSENHADVPNAEPDAATNKKHIGVPNENFTESVALITYIIKTRLMSKDKSENSDKFPNESAFEIAFNPIKKFCFKKFGMEAVNFIENPWKTLSTPKLLHDLIKFLSPFGEIVVKLFIIMFILTLGFLIILGLRIDNTINWYYFIVLFPIFLIAIIAIIVQYINICTYVAFLKFYKDRDFLSSLLVFESKSDIKVVSSILKSVSIWFYAFTTLTWCFSFDCHFFNMTIALIPFFIGYLLYLISLILEIISRMTDIIENINKLNTVLIVLTILFSSLLYDKIINCPAFVAFIPLWLWFIIQCYFFVKFIYKTVLLTEIKQKTMINSEEYDDPKEIYFFFQCLFKLIYGIFLIVFISCFSSKLDGNTIYITWAIISAVIFMVPLIIVYIFLAVNLSEAFLSNEQTNKDIEKTLVNNGIFS